MNDDPIDAFIKAKKLPQTRDTYLALAFPQGEQVIDAEFEASLPDYAKKPEPAPLEDAKIRRLSQ